MYKLLLIMINCGVFVFGLYAQDKQNPRNNQLDNVKIKPIIKVEKIPDTISLPKYAQPVEIPNVYRNKERPLSIKEMNVDMPTLKLNGSSSVFMPGTENLDRLEHLHLNEVRPKIDTIQRRRIK